MQALLTKCDLLKAQAIENHIFRKYRKRRGLGNLGDPSDNLLNLNMGSISSRKNPHPFWLKVMLCCPPPPRNGFDNKPCPSFPLFSFFSIATTSKSNALPQQECEVTSVRCESAAYPEAARWESPCHIRTSRR